ncbi:hypothetical protein ACSV5M_08775 [Cellvibrio sp. ARAG 10.3]|uniref:hypothetical protein n=1 Tax=Cellvibrio sp. ARAG 10.3 TaxID=3451358 RepID=UPI003F46C03C
MRYATKRIYALLMLFSSLAFFSGAVHAVLINFDDLTRVPDEDPMQSCFCNHPLTNEYEAEGLIIDGGYLMEYYEEDPNKVSSPNYLLGSHYLTLSFVGKLPTFVSMIVSAANQEAIYFDVFGTGGLIDEQKTNGWAGPYDNTPYTPNQLMTFNAAEGISSIVVQGYYNLRVSSIVDDITYEYANVPAPSPVILLSLCLVLLGYRKLKVQHEHE